MGIILSMLITVTAMYTGERHTGDTIQCYYEALGDRYTYTIRSYQFCPLSIEVEV